MGSATKSITDPFEVITKGLKDTFDTAGKAINDTSREIGRWSDDGIMLSPTNAGEEEQKQADKADRAAALAAAERLKLERTNERIQRSSNQQTSGSKIILGGKKKSKGSSSVSSGMGLSKGKTGLQT